MIAVRSVEHAEQLLSAGQLPCPDCGTPLRRRGHGRSRVVRGPGATRLRLRPRRVSCPGCSRTHVLLPAEVLARRADTTEVIGTALAAKARGEGARRIAMRLGRPVSTVRRWLQAADQRHADWLYRQGVDAADRIERDLLVRPARQATRLGDALKPARWGGAGLPGPAGADRPGLDLDRDPGRRAAAAGAAHLRIRTVPR